MRLCVRSCSRNEGPVVDVTEFVALSDKFLLMAEVR